MFDCTNILRLYSRVLDNDIIRYQVSEDAIRSGIKSMTEVYRPVKGQISADRSIVADFNDVAHRCAYLHKYAALHTVMVRDYLFAAIRLNYNFFQELIFSQERLKICSLGGGPGSDIIGVLASLFSTFNYVQTSVTVIDYMVNWSNSFSSIINELGSGCYGSFGEMTRLMLQWRYKGANLLKPLTPEVVEEISEASFVTLIKFVSAASCKDAEFMIKNIFTAMKPGAVILFIDNAAGGFKELVSKVAFKRHFIPIFGPINHENYLNEIVKVYRFGTTSCFKTTVSIFLLQKPFEIRPQLQVMVPQSTYFEPSCGYSRRVLLNNTASSPLLANPPIPGTSFTPHNRYLRDLNVSPSPLPPNTALTPYIYQHNPNDAYTPVQRICHSPYENRWRYSPGQVPYTPTQTPYTPNTPRPKRSRGKNGCLPLSRLRHHISKKFDKFKFSSLNKFKNKLKNVSKK